MKTEKKRMKRGRSLNSSFLFVDIEDPQRVRAAMAGHRTQGLGFQDLGKGLAGQDFAAHQVHDAVLHGRMGQHDAVNALLDAHGYEVLTTRKDLRNVIRAVLARKK